MFLNTNLRGNAISWSDVTVWNASNILDRRIFQYWKWLFFSYSSNVFFSSQLFSILVCDADLFLLNYIFPDCLLFLEDFQLDIKNILMFYSSLCTEIFF